MNEFEGQIHSNFAYNLVNKCYDSIKTNLLFNFELFLTTRKKKTVEVKIQFTHYHLQSTMDITSCLRPSEGDMLDGRALNSTTPGAS